VSSQVTWEVTTPGVRGIDLLAAAGPGAPILVISVLWELLSSGGVWKKAKRIG
jgi:hypothetical protein